ncbi:MAG: methionyl-tRNA formyltransferase [Pseudomonadota bacterium]
MRLVFMGSPGFAATVLSRLIADGTHDIACVYSQPPRPSGRGRKLRQTPVHELAEGAGLTVRTPKSLKKAPEQAEFAALDADLAIVVAYGLILPQPILDAPTHGCINLHASLLPRWRGAAPIQRAIMAGDTKTGVQAMVMEAGLDTGPVLATRETDIKPDDTAGSLHDRLAALGAELIPEVLADLSAGRLTPEAQADEGMTYAAKLTPEDQVIDWTRPAAEIDAQIRGLAPAPGAYCHWRPEAVLPEERLKLLMSEVADGQGTAGTVLDDQLTIACGDGAIRILRLQRAGRGPVEAGDFLRGTQIPAGTTLT